MRGTFALGVCAMRLIEAAANQTSVPAITAIGIEYFIDDLLVARIIRTRAHP